jgi:hypothetical protein
MQIDDPKEFLLITALALLVVLGLRAIRPRDRVLLVACTNGDVYSSLSRRPWNAGEIQRCEFATATDERGDLLLCGNPVVAAWSQTWIRKDIKDQIYKLAEQRQVYFQSAGESAGRRRIQWSCIRESDYLTCK